ncbi:hypothetical protein CR513_23968, partial [Mucuna pruriens]
MSRYAFHLDICVVSCSSKKQSIVALLIAKVAIRITLSLDNFGFTDRSLLWSNSFSPRHAFTYFQDGSLSNPLKILEVIHQKQNTPIEIFVTKFAIALSKNPIFQEQSKHIDI